MRKIPLVVWFLVPTILILGIGVWFFTRNQAVLGEKTDSDKPLEVSKNVEGVQEFPIVSRTHIASGTKATNYNSNPPTSGDHWPAAAKSGVYDSQLQDEQIIHNLEHGHVWISYRLDVSQEIKDKLKEIVEKDNWKVVLEPRAENDAKIVLVSWGRLLKMDEPDWGKVEDFIKTYRDRGPENTPD